VSFFLDYYGESVKCATGDLSTVTHLVVTLFYSVLEKIPVAFLKTDHQKSS